MVSCPPKTPVSALRSGLGGAVPVQGLRLDCQSSSMEIVVVHETEHEPGQEETSTVDDLTGGSAAVFWLKSLLAVALVAVIIVVTAVVDEKEQILRTREWIDRQGPWAPVAYVVVFTVATLLSFPASVLVVLAGAMMTTAKGVASVMVGIGLSSTIAFIVSRYLARDLLISLFGGWGVFQKAQKLIQKRAALMVAAIRMIPVMPFGIANYVLGLTNLSFRTYIFWSMLSMFPGVVIFVVGTGSLLKLFYGQKISWKGIMILIAVLITAGVILGAVMHNIRRVEKEA